jgi:hypothetical protein
MSETICVFTGLRTVQPGTDADVPVGKKFSLLMPNQFILSARSRNAMNEREYWEAERDYRYLMYKRTFSYTDDPAKSRDLCVETLRRAVLAFQIIKPLQTSGFTFFGTESSRGGFSLESIYQRPPMDTGTWARGREFDASMLAQVPAMLARIDAVMVGTKAEPKNAITLLELSLEHTRSHALIAGLLAVMGMEAIFNSGDRNRFKRKLCRWIGAKTLAFPDWHSPRFQPPKDTAASVAIPLYTLRSKIAHGADLRSAMPVDLLRKVELIPEMDNRHLAVHLAEAAPYLLCRVLQKAL